MSTKPWWVLPAIAGSFVLRAQAVLALAILSLAVLSLAGCEPDERRGDGEGRVCAALGIEAGHIGAFPEFLEPEPIFADDPVTLQVLWYLGYARTEDTHAGCEVELDGSTIHLRSSASWNWDHEAYDGTYELVATCTTPPLPAGSYTIVHGEQRFPLTVPSSPCHGCFPRAASGDPADPCCDGDPETFCASR